MLLSLCFYWFFPNPRATASAITISIIESNDIFPELEKNEDDFCIILDVGFLKLKR